jgi:hypothetical protein
VRETCQEHDKDNGSESVSVGERHPPSTQTVTHTRRERETNKSTHSMCVGVSEAPMAQRAQRLLWEGQRHNAKGAVPKVKGGTQHTHAHRHTECVKAWEWVGK